MCDKGGECPLQNQAMSNGRGESRYTEAKRVFPKPINLSPQILLDRERCIVCQRCTRFADEIAGDPFIALIERGAQQQIGIAEDAEFLSYFGGNTIQICPVGALTSESYRFRSRPFDLVSTPSIGEHDACGAAIRVDHRRGKVMRRLAGDDPAVNEEWISDKDRFAFGYARQADRLTVPQVRDEDGELRPASWTEAFAVAARGLAAAGKVGVLTGGRLTAEDAYAYSKFARVSLGTNDIDFRARAHTAEEAEFLAAHVALNTQVTYDDLEAATAVVLVGLEPEDEAGTIFLRLRKAHRARKLPVWTVAPFTTRGSRKVGARLLPTVPGAEVEALRSLAGNGELALDSGGVILVGERLAGVPGALSAVAELAATTGARLAWVPRRAGDRGAVEAGALPNLLPGGRPVADDSARVDLGAAWGVTKLPNAAGRDGNEILAAAAGRKLKGLVVAGVDVDDLPDAAVADKALDKAFVVALEVRESAITRVADVVFPVASAHEKSGMFVNWEGRPRPFDQVLDNPGSLSDLRVLAGISEELGKPLGFRTAEQARAEMEQVGPWDGARPGMSGDSGFDKLDRRIGQESAGVEGSPAQARGTQSGQDNPGKPGLFLSSWKQLLDDGRMQDGDPHLRASARPATVLVNQATLDALGAAEGDEVTLAGPLGDVQLPIGVADLADGAVWAPASAPGLSVRHRVGPAGSPVSITFAGGQK
jgi:NADH-quinone oxidoreductase subunit G